MQEQRQGILWSMDSLCAVRSCFQGTPGCRLVSTGTEPGTQAAWSLSQHDLGTLTSSLSPALAYLASQLSILKSLHHPPLPPSAAACPIQHTGHCTGFVITNLCLSLF